MEIKEIIQVSFDFPPESRPKFLKDNFDQLIIDFNLLLKYLESENIEMKLTLFSKGNESEYPYKVEAINGRLMVNL